ncbi:MAG TPA: hypothetical protein VJ696_02980, partial [Rhodanobacteraceae bacterium]|nr:hypothetical protein [Rhodanobacteraceae bacterium]
SFDPSIQLTSGGVTTVTNDVFSGSVAVNGRPIAIVGMGTVVQNSVFDSNASLAGLPVVSVSGLASNNVCHFLIGDTFVKNTSANGPVLSISAPDAGCLSLLANAIFWGNATPDDVTLFSETALLNDNFIQSRLVSIPGGHVVSEVGLTEYDPVFVDWIGGDYSLRDESPLVNRASAGGPFWSCGESDVFGNARMYGGAPDIGAIETQDVIFANGSDFEF